MSHQIISRMGYNPHTNQIETWQHCNNVWPRTDYSYNFDVTDDNLFDLIVWVAERIWQTRKWTKQFDAVFVEFPELIEWRSICGMPYDDYCYRRTLARAEAQRNKKQIVARFKELAKIA